MVASTFVRLFKARSTLISAVGRSHQAGDLPFIECLRELGLVVMGMRAIVAMTMMGPNAIFALETVPITRMLLPRDFMVEMAHFVEDRKNAESTFGNGWKVSLDRTDHLFQFVLPSFHHSMLVFYLLGSKQPPCIHVIDLRSMSVRR